MSWNDTLIKKKIIR